MSMVIYCQNDLRQANSQFWGRIFGSSIQQNRKKKGLSVAEAARLTGMEPSAWAAVEAGHVPETAAQLRSMAGALKLSNAQFGIVVLLCQGAWEA
jgi:transcriptional regulator with XRE-family HTH domain